MRIAQASLAPSHFLVTEIGSEFLFAKILLLFLPNKTGFCLEKLIEFVKICFLNQIRIGLETGTIK